jgi:hypothetical protein
LSEIFVDIEKVVFTNISVSPSRIEHIREAVEMELQRLLRERGIADTVTGGEIERVSSPGIRLAEPYSESYLAARIAQRIAAAIGHG